MIKKFYDYFTKIYSFAVSYYENRFYKKNYSPSELHENGYEIININDQINYNNANVKKYIVNKYMNKDIIETEALFNLIQKIFFKSNLKEIITDKTGMSFSIDYAIIYETFPLPIKEKDNQWYANKWHIDKPFSKNTLKIIIPVENSISENDGGIEIIPKKYFHEQINLVEKKQTFKMIASLDQALLFLPNVCYHRAGNPNSKKRKQMMLQLNPSLKWRINKNIAKKQLHTEPKFPAFSYFFDKYQYLN